MKAIYEPQGKAGEYSPLACNLYTGCSHGCLYCYSPSVLHMPKEMFYNEGQPRRDIILKVKRDLITLRNMNRIKDHVLYCFTCDPYQAELHAVHHLMTEALELHKRFRIPVSILTKSALAISDFDLLKECQDPMFGMTLTFMSDNKSMTWEPKASLPNYRFHALEKAHNMGIKTWVSLEPIIDYKETIECIKQTHNYVDHYYVGKWNYVTDPNYNWENIKGEILGVLDALECHYTVKKESQ